VTESRTAFVCGSSSGIGRAIARRLRDDGLNVVLFARRRELLAEEANVPNTVVVAGDLLLADDRSRLVDETLERPAAGTRGRDHLRSGAPGRTDTERLRRVCGESPPTDTIPLKRLARPAEIAAAASFLPSLDASYVTGSVLVVDGGISSAAH
jgi:NAD(P)-dependent dehydrogenase (short-subunit alcohol dehydrogenase family)